MRIYNFCSDYCIYNLPVMEPEHNPSIQDNVSKLIQSSQEGHCDVVRLLLQSEADVNAVTAAGKTAVMQASKNGHYDVVELLLERGGEVNRVTPAGCSALILASENGHCNVVKLLLDREAEVNRVTLNGCTALTQASQNGHCDIVKLLLEREAEVNAVSDSTALIRACQNGHCNIVKLLLEKKAGVNTATPAGHTALMIASYKGHCNVVKLLLQWEAEVNTRTQDGYTALILASQNGYCNVVRLLLERETEVNTNTHDGCTALIMASQKGYCNVVRLLLEREADVNIITQAGGTALIRASQNGHCDIAKLLLEKRAEVNTVTHITALIAASHYGHCDMVKLLLERKADVNTVTPAGHTALMIASDKGHSNVVKLLLQWQAGVNTIIREGCTALILASQNGHCDVVKLLLEGGAEVNTALMDGRNALIQAVGNGHWDILSRWLGRDTAVNMNMQASYTGAMMASKQGHLDVMKQLLLVEGCFGPVTQHGSDALIQASRNGHSNVVSLLLEREADVNTVTAAGWTALILASQNGHWNVAKQLIDAGADVSHSNQDHETAAMYIIFGETTQKCDVHFEESMKHSWQNPTYPKSHYAMSSACFALVGTLLYNTTSDWFDCHFAKLALQQDVIYAFLPNLFHDNREWNGYIFAPYQGEEGKICLHTMGTAVLCKLPHTALQWLTTCHRDKLVNMLGQTPLHLLAMENHILDDMERKIGIMTERVGFSFSDRDNNGRVPYHIACLCLNAQFLLCGLMLDSDFRLNMLVKDYLGKTPLAYMIYLLCNANESSGVPLLKILSAIKTLQMLIQAMGPVLAMHTPLKACTSYGLDTMNSLTNCFKTDMTVTDVCEVITKAKKICFGTDDVVSLFKCSTRGIVSLSDMQHIVVSVIHLLELIGAEMGNIDPLFECVPELKGSVQEYTKCGKLDELDMSMKLVKFSDYFSMEIREDTNHTFAWIESPCNRYWISAESDMFSSKEFTADFWQIFLKAIDTEVAQAYTKSTGLVIENCKRKRFVGMLNLSCVVCNNVQLISVDIAPSIAGDNLNGYTALLRPRHTDYKQVGNEFYQGLELSTSHKDWDFLKFLQPEVMCGYALVKMLRSLADTFQTEEGRVFSAEEILPSYMVKTAMLWILDPEEKCHKFYPKITTNRENSSSCKDDVLGLCQDLLHDDPDASGLDICDRSRLLNICEKCMAESGRLTMRESILPYVLPKRHSSRQVQNGINLQLMQENWNLDVGNISYQDEIIYSRKFYATSESERVRKEQKNEKPVEISYHKIAYPDINEETARKCRVWALRMLEILQHLLRYDRWITIGTKKVHVVGVRNYYLPDQEIVAKDKDLAVTLCQILKAVLE